MSIKDFIKGLKPTPEEEGCYYLLIKILTHKGINRPYKLTNVTPGLASLIKRNHNGSYLKAQQTFYMNDREGASYIDIFCDMKSLEEELVRIKKGN